MRRSAKHIICLLVVGIQSAWAETQETPVLIPAHEAILKELQNEPGAIRTFKLNDQKQIISIHVCRNLSSEDVAAIKRIETLEELHVGGVLPGYFCCGSPPAEVIKAEKQRLKNFKQAVPLLAELKTVKRMHLGDVPTESELQTVLGWNQLDLLSGPFLPKQCQELAKLPNLRSLFISRSQVALQPISGKFLQRLTNLQNLNLPKNFGDDVFEFIADSPNLKSLKGKGLSGEKLFDFYTTRAGLPPFKALREAGYHVRKRQSERINEIVFRGTHEFSTHFSPKVLDRLRHLEEMRFEYIEGHEAEILQAIREKPLTRLNIIGCDVSQECIQEICNLKTLEELTIDLRSKPMDIAIGDLPNLKTLALGGDLENGSSVASVHRMPELREFRTFRIRIEPSFIEQVAQLPNLTKASFFKESLSLETAASVAKLHNLTDLAFWDCDLDDEKLDLFYGLPNLRSVEFRDTEVSPDARIRFQREHLGLPTAAILKQAGLRIKRNPQGDVHEILFGKEMCREAVKTIPTPNTIRKVRFRMTPMDEAALLDVLAMSSLEEIDFIHSEQMTTSMIASLSKAPRLRRLKVSGTSLDERSKDAFKSLSQLEQLDIRGKGFTKEVIEEIKQALPNLAADKNTSTSN